jgi:hypothetical protein
MYPSAVQAFDHAIAADPGFALFHAARAHALLERGDAEAAYASADFQPAKPVGCRHVDAAGLARLRGAGATTSFGMANPSGAPMARGSVSRAELLENCGVIAEANRPAGRLYRHAAPQAGEFSRWTH